jgi:NosR/NirI family nitrous oxide reductase transcriptional regulator
MVLYTDAHACPPLARSASGGLRAGLSLTPIGADGYFMPMEPVPAAGSTKPWRETRRESWSIRACQPIRYSRPSHAAESTLLRHWLPKSGTTFGRGAAAAFGTSRRMRTLQAAGLGLAMAATLVWVLNAAMGVSSSGVRHRLVVRLERVRESVRLGAKRYVKEGPWWGRRYRREA